jgi:hypothetical protein
VKKLSLALLACGSFAGCVKADSGDILTHGMSADIGAEATGNGTTTVHATLFFGQPINLDFVQLTNDDMLLASNGGVEKVMGESEVLNIVTHQATFATDADGAQFVVDLERTVDAGAPESVVTLPAGFTISPPPTTSSRNQSLNLAWNPSAPTSGMTWSANGDCIDLVNGTIGVDPGTLSLPAATFKKRVGTNVADSCVVTLTMTRSKDGILDRGYGKGGSVIGKQTRSVTFTSTP